MKVTVGERERNETMKCMVSPVFLRNHAIIIIQSRIFFSSLFGGGRGDHANIHRVEISLTAVFNSFSLLTIFLISVTMLSSPSIIAST